ncbi:MAG: SDR family oxidoreductase [Hyphomonadaceae bacterium]|nr:SDR family oxidoreductase [Hyphomonadaceae bacterium]
MLLKNKVAVIYGGGGKIGGAVTRAFAAEGARVFLAGRTLEKLQRVADDIKAAGGAAEIAQVDAFDAVAIEEHHSDVIARAGHIDISFNAVWVRGDLQGRLLLEMPVEDFTAPPLAAATTHFLTATAAARHMVKRRTGVILTISASTSALSGRDRMYHRTGGFGVACAVVEEFTRSLAAEVGPSGVRVVCLRPDGISETWPAEQQSNAFPFKAYMDQGTVLGSLPTLQQVADAAVFAASDRAAAITGAIVNLTRGSIMNSN